MSDNTLKRRSWDYPDCPTCETDVFVDRKTKPPHEHEYRCHWCGNEWS